MDKELVQKKTTKEKIVEAVLELLSQSGYQGTSMRKIAKKVGIRESAIYNHFKNKDELFQYILTTLFSNPFDDFFEKKPPEVYAKKGKKYLLEYISTIKLISFDKKNERLFRIILIELMQNGTIRNLFLKNFYEQNIKNLANTFFIMMQDGLIRSGDPILFAKEFFAPLLYYRIELVLLRMDNKPTTQLATIFEKHVEFFWEGIAVL